MKKLGLLLVLLIPANGGLRLTEAHLAEFTWRSVGPANMGGRIVDIAAVESDPKHFYVAAATGGVWKTTDSAATWTCLFDGSIGDIDVRGEHLWIGTGEANARNSVTWGDGVHKSTNGGKTFTAMGLKESKHIGRVVIHPRDPDTVFVAALGDIWSPSKDRGLYKTTDGGRTWKAVLAVNENVGCIDVALDPENPKIMLAAMYYVRRDAFSSSASPSVFSKEAGLFKSKDGGETWKKISAGLPQSGVGRIGFDFYRKNSDIVYAVVETKQTGSQMGGGGGGGGAYMGVNGEEREGGVALTDVTSGGPADKAGLQKDDVIQEIGGKKVDSMDDLVREIRARKPGDKVEVKIERDGEEKTITVTLGQRREEEEEWWQEISTEQDRTERGGVFRSDDRGETWKHVNTLNPRAFYFSQIRVDPTDDRRVYVLGVSLHVSTDGGKTFSTAGRGAHPDHHAMWINPKDPNHILLGNDGGVYASINRAVGWNHVVNIPLGQFYSVGLDVSNPYRIYGGLQDNGSWGGPSASRGKSIANEEWRRINGADGFVCRADPNDPNIVYAEGQYGALARIDLKSRNGRKTIKPRGQGLRFEWHTPFEISPHDSKRVYVAAQKLFESNDRGDSWKEVSGDLAKTRQGSISTIGLSPIDPDLIWAGTNDGGVWLSKDRGKTWTETPTPTPGLRWVTRVEPSRVQAGACYVTLEGRRKSDPKAYVWKTVDYGRTWVSLAAGLPDEPVYVVCEDPKNPSLLYVGTERSVYVSSGDAWLKLGRGLPAVPVHDLAVHPRDGELVAGTHGRSVWILDVHPLQQLNADVLAAPAHLFVPRDATLWDASKAPRASANGFRGQNPPGAVFTYYLKDKAEKAVLTIRNAEGTVVAELSGSAEAGIHRVAWEPPASGEFVVSLSAGGERKLRVASE